MGYIVNMSNVTKASRRFMDSIDMEFSIMSKSSLESFEDASVVLQAAVPPEVKLS